MINWSLRIHRSVHWVANNKARSSHLRNVHIKKEHTKQNFAQNTFSLHTKTELQTAECPLTSLLTTITWLLGVCKMWPGPGPGHHPSPVHTARAAPGSGQACTALCSLDITPPCPSARLAQWLHCLARPQLWTDKKLFSFSISKVSCRTQLWMSSLHISQNNSRNRILWY